MDLKKHLSKALIDISGSTNIEDYEWEILEDIQKSLKPIEIAVSSLCNRESSLLTAEGIFNFMYSQLEKNGSQLALNLFEALKNRIEYRRQKEIVILMKYLLDPASIGKTIKKSEIQKTAKSILKRLYPINAEVETVVNSSDIDDINEIPNSNPGHSDNPMLDELMESIRKSTTSSRSNEEIEDYFNYLSKEMNLFEITGTKSTNLRLLEESLYSIPPTSVEAERAFSAAGLFNTNLRSSLSDSSLDTLVFLKGHFKRIENSDS